MAPVAVITTLYRSDALDLFELAIASIEAQDYPDEIRIYLCVDGPLPAGHDSWLERNRDRFYLIERNPENLGLALSLNRLIDRLGDEALVFRMDGDDISLPGRFSAQAAWMEAHPGLGLIGCQVEDIDNDGAVIGLRRFPVEPAKLRQALARVTPVLHPSFCIRREVLRDPALRYPNAYLCEDLALLVTLNRAGIGLGNHPEVLFQWRLGAQFFARRRDPKRGWSEMRWYFRALADTGSVLSPAAIYPIARFVFRILPSPLARMIYRSSLRGRVIDVGD